MKIGVDLDDVTAICAVPYLKRFAQEYGVELPKEEEIGWQLLRHMDPHVQPSERDRFRDRLYSGTFFAELEVYNDAPVVLERLANAGHELYYVTARNERRRWITETWLQEKGLMRYAKAVHLRPHGEFRPGGRPGSYDASGSARYKLAVVEQLGLEAFCEDDDVIALALADAGLRVWLFDRPWNREVVHPRIERVSGWSEVAFAMGLGTVDTPEDPRSR